MFTCGCHNLLTLSELIDAKVVNYYLIVSKGVLIYEKTFVENANVNDLQYLLYVFTIDQRGLSDAFAFFTIRNVDQSLVINSEKRGWERLHSSDSCD